MTYLKRDTYSTEANCTVVSKIQGPLPLTYSDLAKLEAQDSALSPPSNVQALVISEAKIGPSLSSNQLLETHCNFEVSHMMEEQRRIDMWQSGDESQTCQFVFGRWNAYGLPLFWKTIPYLGTTFNFSHSPASLMTGNFTSLAAHVGHSRVLVPGRFVWSKACPPQ